jgi:hypothetical protein
MCLCFFLINSTNLKNIQNDIIALFIFNQFL